MTSTGRGDVAFERVLLNALGRLWLTETDRQEGRRVLLALQERLEAAAPVAFKHKVTIVMAENAERLIGDVDGAVASAARRLREILAKDNEAALLHRELLLDEVSRISGILGDRGGIIKGFCNARFYPDGYLRWMRDIDVICASWHDAMELVELLLAEGYEFDLDECSWIKADKKFGRELYGQVFLIRPQGDDFCRVDIHFGTYSAGYAGYLELPTGLAMERIEVSGNPVNVLGAELCTLIAQAHALSDGYVAIKDINDFVALASSRPDLDWKLVGERIRAHRLHPQAALLARSVLSLYDDSRVVAAARELLESLGGSRVTIWQTHNRSWSLRAVVNASFAARWASRRGLSLRAIRDAVRCYLFYIRRLDLAVRPRTRRERVLHAAMARPRLSEGELRPDSCTLLIDSSVVARMAGPLELTSSLDVSWKQVVEPGIEVAEVAGVTLVRLKGRVFVPTFDLLISPSEANAVSHVR